LTLAWGRLMMSLLHDSKLKRNQAANTALMRDRMQGIGGLGWPAWRITPPYEDFMQATMQRLVQPWLDQIQLPLELPLDSYKAARLLAARPGLNSRGKQHRQHISIFHSPRRTQWQNT
jgi:hypothetical protein